MALTTTTKVRLLGGLTTDDISDEDIENIISEATKEVLTQLNVKVIREKIEYIDETRENDIDGSNKTYYVKNWKGKYLSDLDMDGSVDTSDIIVYAVDSDGNETTATVSSVTYDEGKFVLSDAYDSSYSLYVTYAWSYYDVVTPDPLVSLATTYLVIAYCYLKIDGGFSGSVKFGNTTINKKVSESFGIFYDRYVSLMNQLNQSAPEFGMSDISEIHI